MNLLFQQDLEFTAILKVTAVSQNHLFKENDPTNSHMENACDHSLNYDQEKTKKQKTVLREPKFLSKYHAAIFITIFRNILCFFCMTNWC